MGEDEKLKLKGRFVSQLSEVNTTWAYLERRREEMSLILFELSEALKSDHEIIIRCDYPSREEIESLLKEQKSISQKLQELNDQKIRLGLNI